MTIRNNVFVISNENDIKRDDDADLDLDYYSNLFDDIWDDTLDLSVAAVRDRRKNERSIFSLLHNVKYIRMTDSINTYFSIISNHYSLISRRFQKLGLWPLRDFIKLDRRGGIILASAFFAILSYGLYGRADLSSTQYLATSSPAWEHNNLVAWLENAQDRSQEHELVRSESATPDQRGNYESDTSAIVEAGGDVLFAAAGKSPIKGSSINDGRYVTLSASPITAVENATLLAQRNIVIGGTTSSQTTNSAIPGGSAAKTVETFTGASVGAGNDITLAAARTTTVIWSNINAGRDVALVGDRSINIVSGRENSTGSSFAKPRKNTTIATLETRAKNKLAGMRAGRNVRLYSSAPINIASGDVAADGKVTATGGSINVSGVIDRSTANSVSVTKRKGFLSSKKTTVTSVSSPDQGVASTIAGETVALRSVGDIVTRGANVVSKIGTTANSGGNIDISALATNSTNQVSVKKKQSGISFSGGGLFVGTSKSSSVTTTGVVSNEGSIVGTSAGNTSLATQKDVIVTASQVASSGTTSISGESVTVKNATDVTTTKNVSKSSSFGVTTSVSNSLVSGVQTLKQLGDIASRTPNNRVAAVAAIAGGLAVKNTADAVLKDSSALGGANVSTSVGFSKSKSTTETRDETNVGSLITGKDVEITARGAGELSTIRIVGSDIDATSNVFLIAPGDITIASATETDTLKATSSSFGANVGVSLGVTSQGQAGLTISGGINGSKGKTSGTDVANIESNVKAGDKASVVTQGTLTIDGATLAGNSVDVTAKNLTLITPQDTSIFKSTNTNAGISGSSTVGSGQASGGVNFGQDKQNGTFASTNQQTGIFAGVGGFNLTIKEATVLKGAVIASTADPSKNRLTTGTLTIEDIQNNEKFSATSSALGLGLGGKFTQGSNGQINTDGNGNKLPGVNTSIGTFTGTAPVALSADGRQSSTTKAAIENGRIIITSNDPSSLAAAANVSRDTAGANNPLAKQFDDAKRAEIADGFAATKALITEVGTFFNNRATEEADKRKAAKEAADKGRFEEANSLLKEADRLRETYGAGSAARIGATALTGAASGNVTGGFNSLVQSAAVNVLQSLATTQAKRLVDGLVTDDTTRETVRGALQAIVGCAGSVAGGSNSCGSAAIGAAASVLLNNLIRDEADRKPQDRDGDGKIDAASLEEQEARRNLIGTLVTAFSIIAGLEIAENLVRE